MTSSYTLFANDTVLIHGWRRTAQLHDIEDHTSPHNYAELQAQVASQDYFAMLATALDQISQHLKAEQNNDYIVLEKFINDLLYLHQHYKISKK